MGWHQFENPPLIDFSLHLSKYRYNQFERGLALDGPVQTHMLLHAFREGFRDPHVHFFGDVLSGIWRRDNLNASALVLSIAMLRDLAFRNTTLEPPVRGSYGAAGI